MDNTTIEQTRFKSDGDRKLFMTGLSMREIEVARYLFDCLSNQQIADELFITEKTVKFHFTNIFKKLKVNSRLKCLVKMHQIINGSNEV